MTYEEFLAGLNDAGREQNKCLELIAGEVKPQRILEIGSGWGVSAISFLRATQATLLTIDPTANLADFENRVTGMGFKNRVKRMIGRSGSPPSPKYEKEPHHLLDQINEQFDLIFIDGSHEYAYVKEDFLNCLNKIKPKGTIVLDDFYHEHNWT
jgi:predicted O-methyltransferase YrrM